MELKSSDKFMFFGTVVGKANKLYGVKLDLFHPLLTKFQSAGHSFCLGEGARTIYCTSAGREQDGSSVF